MSTFKEWWDGHYQWVLGVLGVVVSWIVSGIIGFYTAIFAVDADIDALRDRVTKTEADISTANGELSSVKGIDSRLKTLEGDFKYVKRETEQVSSTNSAINYLIEVERSKTVNELKEILKKK